MAQFGKFRLTAFSAKHDEDPKNFGDLAREPELEPELELEPEPEPEPELGFVEALSMADEIEGATLVAAVGDPQSPQAKQAQPPQQTQQAKQPQPPQPAATPALLTTRTSDSFSTTPVVSRGPASNPTPAPAPLPAHVGSSDDRTKLLRERTPHSFEVRATAYTHDEADHLKFGNKNALGGELKFGSNLRSAAADWSRFPVGTRFRIKGLPYVYVVDDYGRALVGTDTIDLYKPNMSAMNQWGARHVGIEVLEWGSFNESKKILETRKHKAEHVRKMLRNIEEKMPHIPEALRDGFEV